MFFLVLGSFSRSTLGLHVGYELHEQSNYQKDLCIHHLCLWNPLLCIYLHQPSSIQHYEQQIPTGLQGNFSSLSDSAL